MLDVVREVVVEHLLPLYAELDREQPVFEACRAILLT